jgi:phosphotransferase system enzyme I (PtsP)
MTDKRHNLLNMLCDLGDLSALVSGSQTIENFLQRTVSLVARHLDTPVCSVYLYDESADDLVLNATIGLNPRSVGTVRLKMGEGLVGLVMASRRPVCEGHASQNPQFKYVPATDELPYESFLAVPIHKGEVNIGVLVVQHTEPDYFETADATALKATGAQLAAVLENARLLMDLQRLGGAPKTSSATTGFYKGQKTSEGFACARAILWGKSHVRLHARYAAPEGGTLADFHRALRKTTEQLETLQQRCASRLPESAALIFAAHFMILKDEKFVSRMKTLIRSGAPATQAIRDVAGHYIRLFEASPHPYIREKVSDIEDLAGRLMGNLNPSAADGDTVEHGNIVIAQELYPSEMLKLSAEGVAGIVLTNGGVTSHVAILARALKIPMVIVDAADLFRLPDETVVLVDGDMGNVYVDPSNTIIRRFETRNQARLQIRREKNAVRFGTARTADGTRVDLLANINLLSELPLAQEMGAQGVGLYRTEFPFLIRPAFPSETEQYLVYRQVVEAMGSLPVTFRTLDIGGEKTLSYTDTADEPNPELGMRSIRFSLAYRDIFENQVRALLRAAVGSASAGIMFPLISSLDDFCQARAVVRACQAQLASEAVAHHATLPIGMMVELPAVVELMAEFAEEADFFAIGTNDFVQYMLGVDRSNKRVAEYYRPEHPSVLRGLQKVVAAASKARKPISVCGEMGHDEAMIPFLLGIGVRRLSIDPQFMPAISQRISALRMDACREHARELLAAGSIEAVRNVISRFSRD